MKNKYLSALFITILFFAISHIIIIIISVLKTGNLEFINIFKILGLSEFIPGIEKGQESFFLSALIIVVSYAAFYFKFRKPKN